MNKKINSALFILGATVVNVLLMLVIFVALLVLHLRFLAPMLSDELAQILLIVIFFGTIVLTYVLYNWLMKLFAKRVDMDKYFDPLIKPRKK